MGQGDPYFDANPYEAPKADLRGEFTPPIVGQPGPATVRFEVLSEAWEYLKAQLGTWVLLTLVMLLINYGVSFALNIVGALIQAGIAQARPSQAVMGAVLITTFLVQMAASVIVTAYLMGGMFRAACNQVRGLPIEVGMLFSATDVLPSLILALFLYYLAVLLGFILLIIPGFLVAGRLMFTFPLVADGRLKATDAMGRSWSALQGQTLMAALFSVVAGLLSGLGVCACGVGLLFTMPIYYLAIAILYRDFFHGKAVPEVI